MEIHEKILKALFTSEQLDNLQSIYDENKHQYLNDLDCDPFAYDYTDHEVKKTMATYLNLEVGDYVIENLYKVIYIYFI